MSWMLQLDLAFEFITHKIGHPLAASLSGQQGIDVNGLGNAVRHVNTADRGS